MHTATLYECGDFTIDTSLQKCEICGARPTRRFAEIAYTDLLAAIDAYADGDTSAGIAYED